MEKVNWETVNQYSQLKTKDGQNLYLKLLGSYRSHIYADLEDLHGLAEKGDFEELASLAHKLKSSSGNLGFDSIQTYLHEIEEMIVVKKKHDKESIIMLLGYIAAELKFVIQAVETKLQ